MTNKSKGAFFAVAGLSFLALACLFAVLFPGAPLLWVAGGFVAYVACGRKAVIAWRLDDQVFDHPHKHFPSSRPPAGIVAFALLFGALAFQTLTYSGLWDAPVGGVGLNDSIESSVSHRPFRY